MHRFLIVTLFLLVAPSGLIAQGAQRPVIYLSFTLPPNPFGHEHQGGIHSVIEETAPLLRTKLETFEFLDFRLSDPEDDLYPRLILSLECLDSYSKLSNCEIYFKFWLLLDQDSPTREDGARPFLWRYDENRSLRKQLDDNRLELPGSISRDFGKHVADSGQDLVDSLFSQIRIAGEVLPSTTREPSREPLWILPGTYDQLGINQYDRFKIAVPFEPGQPPYHCYTTTASIPLSEPPPPAPFQKGVRTRIEDDSRNRDCIQQHPHQTYTHAIKASVFVEWLSKYKELSPQAPSNQRNSAQ